MSETSSTTKAARRGARRLTEAAIERTKPPASGRIDIADAVVTGLYLRITAGDKRSWSLLYRAPEQKRQQRLTLGQRRAEVAEMRWSELDIEAKVWTIPIHRTKNERPHDVPFLLL